MLLGLYIFFNEYLDSFDATAITPMKRFSRRPLLAQSRYFLKRCMGTFWGLNKY
jgi:hypothetical protein